MKEEIKEILEDYKKLVGEITEKLDNTAEYESWLIIQDYFDKLFDYITSSQEVIETIKNTNKLLIQQKAQSQDDLDILDNRIDKAVDYIMKYYIFDDNGSCYQSHDFDATNMKRVVDMLEGKDE